MRERVARAVLLATWLRKVKTRTYQWQLVWADERVNGPALFQTQETLFALPEK